MEEEDVQEQIMFRVNSEGVLEEYKEPFASIDFETEEDFNIFTEIYELGR